jgi:hypothetical protein
MASTKAPAKKAPAKKSPAKKAAVKKQLASKAVLPTTPGDDDDGRGGMPIVREAPAR